MHGFLLIDKPKGLTSFDVVREVRKAFNIKRVGHTGTLDPLATGLLLVALGQATKFIEYLVGCEKSYDVSVVFGAVSSTYDAEGEIEKVALDTGFSLSEKAIKKLIDEKFSSKILQIPPRFSAKNIDGRRAYDLARKGQDFELKPLEVEIYDFVLNDFSYPSADFAVHVSSGTYVRSLVHDLGRELKCGAYVKELRRTKLGAFTLEDKNVCSLEDLGEVNLIAPYEIMKTVLPYYEISGQEYDLLRKGLSVSADMKDDLACAVIDKSLLGVLEKRSDGRIKFKKQIIFDFSSENQ